MRRSISLASVAAVVAAMSACSNDVTGPSQNVPKAPSLSVSCRSGYMMSSGRCSEESAALSAPTRPAPGTTVTTQDECRLGYLLSTGRCSTDG